MGGNSQWPRAAPAASEPGALPAQEPLASAGPSATVSWEVDVASLQKNGEGSAPLELREHSLQAPSIGGHVNILVSGQASLSVEGEQALLLWNLQLPHGTRALVAQRAGPLGEPTLRIGSDVWDAHGPQRGCGSWPIGDAQSLQGSLQLCVSVLFAVLPDGLPTLPKRFSLGCLLGEGKNGSVREVSDGDGLAQQQRHVAKLSSKKLQVGSSSACDLMLEAAALSQVRNEPGFPKVVGLYSDAGTELLVISRLSRDLESLRRTPSVCPSGQFQPATIVEVGTQVLRRLEALHSKGLAHCDVKPKNLMTGLNDPGTIHLVDFGLCRPFRLGALRATPKEGAKTVGTTRFCSVPAHTGERSPRSDLECLAYVLVWLATGGLPWQGCEGSSKRERSKEMWEKKQQPKLMELHLRERLGQDRAGVRLSEMLMDLVLACQRLALDARPDYDSLVALVGRGCPEDVEYGQDGGLAHCLDWLAA